MEFQTVVRRRKMVRKFTDAPVPPEVVERILDNATRAPSAGYSQGWAFVALTTDDERRLFWETTTDEQWTDSARHEGITAAPVIIVPLSHKQAYLDRYSLPDKQATGIGGREDLWPVPYWDVDTAFASMSMLLTAVDAGLGALFFGLFRGETDLLRALGVPDGYRAIGAIAIGHPAEGDIPSPSLKLGKRPDTVHYGRWGGTRPT
jgi:nitroreductase